jgi:hypothetical protein
MKDLYLVDGYNVIFGRPDIFDRGAIWNRAGRSSWTLCRTMVPIMT